MPLSEFSESSGIPADRIVELIRDGTYRGEKIGEDWFVFSPDPGPLAPPLRSPSWLPVLTFAALGWLLALPVFAANASHFGWGFFPLIATKIASPFVALSLAAVFIWVSVATRHSAPPTSRWILVVLRIDLAAWVGVWVLMWFL